MRLHTLFTSYKREEMTIKNVARYRLARDHALRNIPELETAECTIRVTTIEEKAFFEVQFRNFDFIKVVIEANYAAEAPLLMDKYLRTPLVDVFHYTWDDHGIHEDCYTHGLRAMIKYFPKNTIHSRSGSYNGVIGVDIANYPKHWPWKGSCGSQLLIGVGIVKTFEQNYSGKSILCPDYKRVYWECEFGAYLRFHNAIWYCHEAKLDHWRPDISMDGTKWKLDQSHIEGRKGSGDGSMNRDFFMYRERRRRGYYWGLNFDLVGDLDEAIRKRGGKEERQYDIVDTRDSILSLDMGK